MSSWNPNRPYQNLPDLPPKCDLETKPILKALVGAKSELAALNSGLLIIPNPAILINAIPLLEAKSSSEIENIVTTADELFRYEHAENTLEDSSPIKETLRYRRALRAGFDSLATRPLNTTTAIEICRNIRGEDSRIRDIPGTKIANPATGEIIYTPPEGDDVLRAKLANWEAFLHDDEQIDPLIRIAVAHYQFEAIHPFFDGNGRTGRIINILALIEFDLLSLPVLYLSRYIIENKSDYYDRLLRVTTDSDWEPWIIYMLSAIETTAKWTSSKIKAVRDLQETFKSEFQATLPKIYRAELVDIAFQQPYCRIENVVDSGLAKRQTASTWLLEMSRAGFLEEMKVGRNKLFLNTKLLALLTSKD